MSWSSYPERREPPLGTITTEQLERAAIWESWFHDFGGRTFVEPLPPSEYVLLVLREGRRDAIMILAERWEALDLRDAMIRHGHDVELEVRRLPRQ